MRPLCCILIVMGWMVQLRADDAFRVMSWNIRYDNPNDGANRWGLRKDWVAELIRSHGADIAGLQEVLVSQLKDLKERLPEMEVFGVGRDDGIEAGEFSPVLFRRERFELLSARTYWLSPTPDKPGSRGWNAALPRILTWIRLKDRKTSETFTVLNTHFDHRGVEARTESARLIQRLLREEKKPDESVILTGDFNTGPDSEPLAVLTDTPDHSSVKFRDTRTYSKKMPEGPDSTWNGFDAIVPGRRIDFVFTSPDVAIVDFRIADDRREERFPSDHLPVITTIDLTGAP
jgi:endonuclease/exonuclease/phosphatase family metal-dependent hydrolase